jgi:hypothetical protein
MPTIVSLLLNSQWTILKGFRITFREFFVGWRGSVYPIGFYNTSPHFYDQCSLIHCNPGKIRLLRWRGERVRPKKRSDESLKVNEP